MSGVSVGYTLLPLRIPLCVVHSCVERQIRAVDSYSGQSYEHWLEMGLRALVVTVIDVCDGYV